jgi:glutaredoxin
MRTYQQTQKNESTEIKMTQKKTVTVYTREDCHLCQDAITTIRTVAESVATPVEIELVDVDEQETLRAEYGDRVPYVLIDDQPAFKYRVNKQGLQKKLTR